MTHSVKKLVITKSELKKSYVEDTEPVFESELTNASCVLPADDVMLAILHRLIRKEDEHGTT